MKTFKLKITQTENYSKIVDIEAPTLEEAIKQIEASLDEIGLSEMKNTYDGTETEISKILTTHEVETLFDAGKEYNDEQVIKVSDLSDIQKKYLGL